MKRDHSRRPEAERAYLTGLLELLTDDPARCRAAVALVDAATLSIEAGAELLAAIEEAAGLEAPGLPDVLRIARERAGDGADPERALLGELAALSTRNRGGYALAVDRHAREITAAAMRRLTAAAAERVAAVAADPGAGVPEIEAAVAAVAEAAASGPAEGLEWEPFPLDLLPEPAGEFVAEAAERLSADPVLVAFPLLASVAGAIGNRRRIELWPGWREPAILWMASVAEPGSMKSPCADEALQFVRQRQRDAFEDHAAAAAAWEHERREHERASRRRDAPATAPPERPTAERILVDDTTIEALGPILAENPGGVLVARDELSGWFDHDRYSSGKGGAEVARWLTLYSAGPLTVDRKLSGTLHVPAACASITGTIQPRVLSRVVGSKHIENGLLQRFILAAPPRRMKEIPSRAADFAATAATRAVFETLAGLRPAADGSPVVLDLEPEAGDAWRTFYREHAALQFATSGPIGEMLSKAEAWAARLALVIHMTRQADEPTLGNRIDADSITRGIGIARWAAREWERVFGVIERGGAAAEDAGLRAWLRSRGGAATARELARHGPAAYRAPGAAEAALRRLTRSGAAEWVSRPTGGRPAETVRLR